MSELSIIKHTNNSKIDIKLKTEDGSDLIIKNVSKYKYLFIGRIFYKLNIASKVNDQNGKLLTYINTNNFLSKIPNLKHLKKVKREFKKQIKNLTSHTISQIYEKFNPVIRHEWKPMYKAGGKIVEKMPDGFGREVIPKGFYSIVEGSSSWGRKVEEDIVIYEGNYLDGQRHGKGVLRPEQGQHQECFEGDFEYGQIVFGHYTKKEFYGSSTSGSWGVVEEYHGAFKDGKYHGKGKLEKDGVTFEGTFNEGVFTSQ